MSKTNKYRSNVRNSLSPVMPSLWIWKLKIHHVEHFNTKIPETALNLYLQGRYLKTKWLAAYALVWCVMVSLVSKCGFFSVVAYDICIHKSQLFTVTVQTCCGSVMARCAFTSHEVGLPEHILSGHWNRNLFLPFLYAMHKNSWLLHLVNAPCCQR